MNKKCWVLATPDGENFVCLRLDVKKTDHPEFPFPRSPMILFASEKVAREAIQFFGLPADLCATPWQLETDEQYNGFLADAWDLGARELLLIEELTCNPRHMQATPYSFFPANSSPESPGGGGKSSPSRWVWKSGYQFNWN